MEMAEQSEDDRSLTGSARLFQPVYFGVRLHRIERLR
jgi:hypothetical protein